MRCIRRGPKTIAVTITEHWTDEDGETPGITAKRMTDAFFKRPSLEDRAMEGITEFLNGQLFRLRRTEGAEDALCDYAALFVLGDRARWLAGGGSVVYHLVNGQLLQRSMAADAQPLGMAPEYTPRLEDAFRLSEGVNAFLLCSKEMAKQLTQELLESTLQEAASAEQWLQALVGKIGEKRQYCANTLILPQVKRGKRWFWSE